MKLIQTCENLILNADMISVIHYHKNEDGYSSRVDVETKDNRLLSIGRYEGEIRNIVNLGRAREILIKYLTQEENGFLCIINNDRLEDERQQRLHDFLVGGDDK